MKINSTLFIAKQELLLKGYQFSACPEHTMMRKT